MLLQWQYSGSDQPGFEIYRSLGPNGAYQYVTGTGSNTHNYTDTVPADGQYCYKIQASLYGDSPLVGPACAWTQLPPATNVRLTGVTDNTLTFAWTDNATNETNNQVVLTTPKSIYSAGAHPGTGPMSYQINGLKPNTQYCATIVTDGTNGRTATSAQACGTTSGSQSGGTGVKQSLWWDCVSGDSLYLWTFDATTGAWQNLTTLSPAYDGAGQCGPTVTSGYSFSLPSGHLMTFVVVDPQAYTCGENNPLNPGCQRATWQALGDAQGVVIPLVVY
jgi:hypothetical protein